MLAGFWISNFAWRWLILFLIKYLTFSVGRFGILRNDSILCFNEGFRRNNVYSDACAVFFAHFSRTQLLCRVLITLSPSNVCSNGWLYSDDIYSSLCRSNLCEIERKFEDSDTIYHLMWDQCKYSDTRFERTLQILPNWLTHTRGTRNVTLVIISVTEPYAYRQTLRPCRRRCSALSADKYTTFQIQSTSNILCYHSRPHSPKTRLQSPSRSDSRLWNPYQ